MVVGFSVSKRTTGEGEVRENRLTLSYAEVGTVKRKWVCMLVCVGAEGGSKNQ